MCKVANKEPSLPVEGLRSHAQSFDKYPVPDWIVSASRACVNFIVIGLVVECCAFIIIFGAYLEPTVVWVTHASTIVGSLVCLGLFESVKCLVVAGVALVSEEAAEKEEEARARRERMALKAQGLQDRSALFTSLGGSAGAWRPWKTNLAGGQYQVR